MRRAAERALAGSDEVVAGFFAHEFPVASEADTRAEVEEMVAVGGPSVRRAATQVLSKSADEVEWFLSFGWTVASDHDLRLAAVQALSRQEYVDAYAERSRLRAELSRGTGVPEPATTSSGGPGGRAAPPPAPAPRQDPPAPDDAHP